MRRVALNRAQPVKPLPSALPLNTFPLAGEAEGTASNVTKGAIQCVYMNVYIQYMGIAVCVCTQSVHTVCVNRGYCCATHKGAMA